MCGAGAGRMRVSPSGTRHGDANLNYTSPAMPGALVQHQVLLISCDGGVAIDYVPMFSEVFKLPALAGGGSAGYIPVLFDVDHATHGPLRRFVCTSQDGPPPYIYVEQPRSRVPRE